MWRVALVAITTAVLGWTASAQGAYGCWSPGPKCAAKNGPNIAENNWAWSHNLSGVGVCAEQWWWDNEESYERVAKTCWKESAYADTGTTCVYPGHSEVRRYFMAYEYWLEGEEGEIAGTECIIT